RSMGRSLPIPDRCGNVAEANPKRRILTLGRRRTVPHSIATMHGSVLASRRPSSLRYLAFAPCALSGGIERRVEEGMNALRPFWIFCFMIVLGGPIAPVGCDTADQTPDDDGGGQGGTIPIARCDDGIRNGGETDVDCGGPCGPCADGQSCRADDDCVNECVDG